MLHSTLHSSLSAGGLSALWINHSGLPPTPKPSEHYFVLLYIFTPALKQRMLGINVDYEQWNSLLWSMQ
jgi:hypothetical protein